MKVDPETSPTQVLYWQLSSFIVRQLIFAYVTLAELRQANIVRAISFVGILGPISVHLRATGHRMPK